MRVRGTTAAREPRARPPSARRHRCRPRLGGGTGGGARRLRVRAARPAAGATEGNRAPPRPHAARGRAVGHEDRGRAPAGGGSSCWPRRSGSSRRSCSPCSSLCFPGFEEDLGLSKAGAGLLTSAYAIGAFAGAFPSIWSARRFGVKATVLAGLILLAVSSVAFTVPDSAWLVFTARLGQGFGSAFAYTGALAWVAAVVPPARRGEAIGIAFAAAFSGALVGPLIGAAAELVGVRGRLLHRRRDRAAAGCDRRHLGATRSRRAPRPAPARARTRPGRRPRDLADRADRPPPRSARRARAAAAGRARLERCGDRRRCSPSRRPAGRRQPGRRETRGHARRRVPARGRADLLRRRVACSSCSMRACSSTP